MSRHRYRCVQCGTRRLAAEVPPERVCQRCSDGAGEMAEYYRNVAIEHARTSALRLECELRIRANREAAGVQTEPEKSLETWSDGEVRTLRYMVSRGYSAGQIAERLGRSESSVANARQRYVTALKRRRKAA